MAVVEMTVGLVAVVVVKTIEVVVVAVDVVVYYAAVI